MFLNWIYRLYTLSRARPNNDLPKRKYDLQGRNCQSWNGKIALPHSSSQTQRVHANLPYKIETLHRILFYAQFFFLLVKENYIDKPDCTQEVMQLENRNIIQGVNLCTKLDITCPRPTRKSLHGWRLNVGFIPLTFFFNLSKTLTFNFFFLKATSSYFLL